MQSRKSTNAKQSSKSSEVYIKEDNEPSIGRNGSRKLLNRKSSPSSLPANSEANHREQEELQ